MQVLVTGASGFIGRNLVVRLEELPGVVVLPFGREHDESELDALVAQADFIMHLAGENRPVDPGAFTAVNDRLTARLCSAIRATGRHVPLLLTSSMQAAQDNPYGLSKRAAEAHVARLAAETGNPVEIFRLPGVFGKWCRPNYNSVVATFCHNIACDLPIQINNPDAVVRLVYVDDVISRFIHSLTHMSASLGQGEVAPVHEISLGELAAQIQAFRNCRSTLIGERVGQGLVRALYATYVSYLPPASFSYAVPSHADARGVFVEMLKTQDSGQFSYFTAHPGVTRGGHYHHSKTEKFLVIKGEARFGFRQIVTGERFELYTSGDRPQIVETVPGWTHDITNVGSDEMVVMLWANEIFDRANPDTIACKV